MINFFLPVFLVKLEKYKKVALFVHFQPDFDAYASAFGLRRWIKDNYPNTIVYLMIPPETFKSSEKFLFDSTEQLPFPKDLEDSLGIILDTPKSARVLTQMHSYCKELVLIDHHPREDNFAQLELIEPSYSATSHILAEIFFELEETQSKIFSEDIAQYFYSGIITDTNNFMSFSMVPSTYSTLSKLVSKGINREAIHDFIFVKPINYKLFNNEVLLRSYMTKNGLIYSIVPKKLIKKYGVQDSPNVVNMLENVAGVESWTTLSYDYETGNWKCSIRSKDIAINSIAQNFGGGGHKNMAAVVFNRISDFYKLLVVLDEHLKTRGKRNVTKKEAKFNLRFFFCKVFKGHKKILKNLQ